MPNSPLLTAGEAAAFLRCSRTTIYALIGTGRLRGLRLGRKRLFSEAELTALVGELEEAERGFVPAGAIR